MRRNFRRVAARHGATIRSEALALDITTAEDAAAKAGDPVRTSMPLLSPQSQAATIIRRTFSGTHVLTGATVEKPGKFRWTAYGFELAMENPDAFDGNHFGRLLDAFEQAVPSRRNASVIGSLKASGRKSAFLAIVAGHILLPAKVGHNKWMESCGSPCRSSLVLPIRQAHSDLVCVGSRTRKAYQFDTTAWKVWLGSLFRRHPRC